jgi:hypothetical protein
MHAEKIGSVSDRSRFAFDRALGPLQKYLARPGAFNVHANPSGRIFIEERGRSKYEAPEQMTEVECEGLIGICQSHRHRADFAAVIAAFVRRSRRLRRSRPSVLRASGSGSPATFRNHASEVIPWASYDIDDEGEDGTSLIRAGNVDISNYCNRLAISKRLARRPCAESRRNPTLSNSRKHLN